MSSIQKKKLKWYVIFEGARPGIYGTWAECVEALGHLGGKQKFKAYQNADEAWSSFRKYNEKKNEDPSQIPPNQPPATVSLSSFYTRNEGEESKPQIKVPVVKKETNLFLRNPAKIESMIPIKTECDMTPPPTKKPKNVKNEPWTFGQQYPSIVVDAACTNPSGGIVEFRCCRILENKTVVQIFAYGPFSGGSNNIGEYVALVKAIEWVRNGHYDTSESHISMIYSDSAVAIKWVTSGFGCNTKLNPELICPELKAEIKICDDLVKNPEFLAFAQKMCKKWITDEWGEIPADYGRK